METPDKDTRNRLLELSIIEKRIAEIQHLIDFLPEDLAEYKDEIDRFDGFLFKYNNKKNRTTAKIEECERLLKIEKERLEKVEKLMKISKDQNTYIAAKKFESVSRKVVKQMETVIGLHLESVASIDEAIKQLNVQKKDVYDKFEDGRESLVLGHGNMKNELNELRNQEKTLRLTIDKEFLHMFDPISSRNIRPVVVQTEITRCPACSGEFPDRLLQEMFSGAVHKCQSCQRLMVAFIPQNVVLTTVKD